jgi:CheY-like chemotaxis protein
LWTHTDRSTRRILLILEVEDTGIGIAPEDQARMFDVFVQVSEARVRKGSGLGLSIIRQFVQMMGGTIRVQSTPGEGSLFRVELPVELVEESEVVVTGRDDPERVVGLAPGQPAYRILIVEDRRTNWLLLKRLLEDAGFLVRVAEDGDQAMDSFRIWQPALIWMDLRLHTMGGLEAAEQIRAMEGGHEVRIVALTASAFVQEREEVLAAGFDDFIRKPYRREEIFECMARQLGVRYLYETAQQSSPAQPMVAPALEALALVPHQLRTELAAAVVRLDPGPIAELICRVREHDARLGEVLATAAKRFAYTEILDAIQGSDDSVPRDVPDPQ